MGVLYADSPDKIARVVEAAHRSFDRGEPIGLDTEFYNVDVGKQSCVARARLHLLSLAVKRFPHQLSPRGFHVADAAVFTREALRDTSLRRLLEGPGRKCVHNLPVDAHTLCNGHPEEGIEGIELYDGINTLAVARWAWPHRARGAGFTLGALGDDYLGATKTEDFRDLFSQEVTEYRSTFRKVQRCECGNQPCRKRSTSDGHRRILEIVETQHPKTVRVPVPLNDVVLGHPLWPRALAYSAADAVLALGVYDLATLEMRKKLDIPWLEPLTP